MQRIENKRQTASHQSETGQNKHSDRCSRKREPAPKYMIKEEIHALLGVIKSLRDQAIFRLAFHHGLRVSELGIIQMRDYRPSTRMEYDRLVLDRLKGSIGGDTILVPAAALAIRKWVKKRGLAPGAMFLSQKKSPISRQRLDELMKHYSKLAGIPPEKAHFHTLKHTCGTILLSERKESIVDVQHHLGHADIRSTMVYAKLTEAANEERAARLKNWK
jgi:integrase